MKILELCLSPGIGGLEMYAVKCCASLGHKNTVLAVTASRGMVYSGVTKLSAWHTTLNPFVRKLPLYSAYCLAKIIDRESVDIIHIHWNKDLPLASLAKRLSKRKPRLVVSRHMKITRSKRDVYHRFMYNPIDLILNVTRTLAEVAVQKLPVTDAAKSHYLYLGVEAPRQLLDKTQIGQHREKLGIGREKFVVGVFGRIEAYKAQHLLIQAAAPLIEQNHPIHLMVIGSAMDSDYLQSLHTMAKALNIHKNILFHDFVEDPQTWMQLCDCVVLTTIEETFGLVLIEAMRSGVCVLGSNRGGVLEIIQHGENGLLFESGSSADLSSQLASLVKDKNLHFTLSEKGKVFADKHFDQRKHFDKLENIFVNLLQKQQP